MFLDALGSVAVAEPEPGAAGWAWMSMDLEPTAEQSAV
jgi:hypothetical protein